MWPISSRLEASLKASNHDVISKVEVLVDGDLALTIEGKTIVDPVTGDDVSTIDGSVDVRRATISRACTLSIADMSDVLKPSEVGDLLVPLRSEVRLYRGLMYSDRTSADEPGELSDREYVPIGTLVVTDVTSSYPSVEVVGRDRMELVSRQKLLAPYLIARGTDVTTAITKILTTKVPAERLDYVIPAMATDVAVELCSWLEGKDPADILHDLAESIGMMMYVDPMGVFTMRPEPDLDDDAVWDYVEGEDSMLMPWPTEQITSEGAFNVAVVTGEQHGDSPLIRGEARNVNPASALYWPKVGLIPSDIVSSPLYATQAQANLGAATKLKKAGMSDIIAFAGVVNPALMSGDVVHVESTHPDHLSADLLIDDFTIPLRGAGPQSLTARSKIVFSS